MEVDRMAKRSSFGRSIRKRLSDITNYQPQPKSSTVFDQTLPLNDSSSSVKEHIGNLLKENAGLLQTITEKNKVIELNGLELQKLRVMLQKTQLQNWNLAQSNSHMMAELNLGKQKLKTLQHQLNCKDAMLKTIKKEHQDNGNVDKEQPTVSKNMHSRRSQSIASFKTTVQRASEKETFENKRRCVRRQSARFASEEQHEPKEENLFEIEDLKIHEDGPTARTIEQKVIKSGTKLDPRELHRTSLGRPSRRAAEKIQSYKETPVNIKMRRPE
ncbi:uncharacterized protein [Rutidosis leptorrhynchoides]|uniref:uncharacterized protein n=1 Tax=Rutidosis leptorrhynchoides TaxID=125765 RepID=UPI003A99C228